MHRYCFLHGEFAAPRVLNGESVSEPVTVGFGLVKAIFCVGGFYRVPYCVIEMFEWRTGELMVYT